MNRRLTLLWILVLFAGLLPAGTAYGQTQPAATAGDGAVRHTMIFRGTPIDRALKELVDTTKIDLIYNAGLIRDPNDRVFSISREKTPGEILSDILEGTDLDYILLSSGTYVIIRSAEAEPRFGRLVGVVYDQQTGEPLDGAHVMLADVSAGSSTNGSGRFTIAPLLSGRYEVTVTYVGYQPVRDTVRVPAGGETPYRFFMEARPVFVEPLVVSSIQPRLPYYGEKGDEVMHLTESGATFTGSPDAIRSTYSVLGMNFSLSLADFHIQGGSAGDHKVLLDGVPVYNPVSLGRLTGAFSPYALDKITIRKAGFGAEAGSQLSGIIEVEQDVAGSSDHSYIVQADPLNVNGRADFTASPGGATFRTMVAARTNLWQWYRKPSLSGILKEWDRLDPLLIENLLENRSPAPSFRPLYHDSDIRFYDLHLRSELRFNEFHTSSLSFYRGMNYLQTRLLSHNDNEEADVPDFMYTQDGYDWLNTAGKLQHDWLAGPRLNASVSASLSSHSSVHHFAMADSDRLTAIPPGFEAVADALAGIVSGQAHRGDRNRLNEWSLEATFDYSLRRNHMLHFGIETDLIDNAFELSDPFFHPTATGDRFLLLAGFINDDIALGRRTTLTAGSRFTYAPGSRGLFAEPRLDLQHDAPGTGIGYVSFRMAAGLYRQFINQFDVTSVGPSAIVPSTRFWVPADYTTGVPKAYHANTEVLIEPAEHLSLRWEAYYKWHPRVLAVDYHALLETPVSATGHYESQADFILPGKSYSYGTGFSLSQMIEPWRMETTLSYQYEVAQQRLPKRFGNRYLETPWNTPHKLMAAVNWNITGGLVTSLRWQSIWGKTWAYKRAYYDYLTIDQNRTRFGPYRVDSPSDDSLTPFHQLDVGISYGQAVSASSVKLRLDLINLLDRRNVLEKQIVPQPASSGTPTYRIEERTLPGITPSLGIEFRF